MTKFTWFGPQRMAELKAQGKRNMRKAISFLRRDIVERFTKTPALTTTGPRGGVRRKKGGGYVPSRPGEPPAIQTGTLRRSMTTELDVDHDGVVGRVGPGKEGFYARYLEFGTRKMKARPHLRPAIDRNRRRIFDILSRD